MLDGTQNKESKLRFTANKVLIAAFIFFIVFFVHSESKVIVSTDSMWSIYLAQSLLNDRDFILDEYKGLAKERKNYGLRKRKGELYSYFPVGTAIMATPFVWAYNHAPFELKRLLPGFPKHKQQQDYTAENMNLRLQRLIASVFVSGTILIIFFIALNFISLNKAFLLSLTLAFGSSFWSTASRGLWQHGPSALLISLSILLLLRLKKNPELAGFSGLVLAFAYVVRPTNAIAFLCVGAFLALNNIKAFRIYFLSSLLIFIPFVTISYEFFNHFLPPYYSGNRLRIGWHFPIAFAANLFSPNRGLFFLSPVFIPALYVMIKSILSLKYKSLEFILALAFFGHLTAISLFPEWWGGHAFGPRYMSETMPYVAFFFILWVENFKFNRIKSGSLIIAAIFSFYVHCKGATSFQTFLWNTRPVNIDDDPLRVWDFKDMQFLRK